MKNTPNLPLFEQARVLVYGDVMLDRYWYGDTSRVSPEAPVPVVCVNREESRPGGAANVALNIAALGARTQLFGLVGCDQQADDLQQQLSNKHIDCHFLNMPNCPTISKLRVIGQQQQLIRMDFEKAMLASEDSRLIVDYQKQLADTDVVVLSDYAKGSLQHAQVLIRAARDVGIPVLVDPKNNDFTHYAGATLITPNLKEFEAAVGKHCETQEELVEVALHLIHSAKIDGLLITCGKDGMLLVVPGEEVVYLPTRALDVFDVTGAGDTVIGVMAAALAAGESLVSAARFANLAAGIVVGKLGAETVSVPELRRAWQRQMGIHAGVLSEEELKVVVSDAKAHGEKIVMTNGCFDLLHAGHVQYLEEARALGQRLIVAVNSDESVRALKGPSRPMNTLQERMEVLAALRSVDWVVPFSEDTPEQLISSILPDVLVKGADYKPEDIAGSKAVIANGGDVKTIRLREGCSTSRLIEKIRDKAEV